MGKWRYSLTSAPDGDDYSASCLVCFTPAEKYQLGWPHSWSGLGGEERKLPQPGIDVVVGLAW
jgi:hypothetical protein